MWVNAMRGGAQLVPQRLFYRGGIGIEDNEKPLSMTTHPAGITHNR